MSYQPTAEQETAREMFKTGRSLAIEAGAGAGKTSTLVLLARSTQRRGQYIAFNKAIVTEAGAKMPRNVTCSTAHSLAYRNVIPGTRFQDRLKNSARIRSLEIAAMLGINAPIKVQFQGGEKILGRAFLAGLAMRGVTRFCQSADLEPEAGHVPYVDGIDVPPGATTNNRIIAQALVPAMRKAWADLTDERGALPFKHDHYLKMWHLQGAKINAEFILFDEAQDANPVLVAIVKAQEHAQLVWVGDSQQQIYTFTGAVNALKSVGAEQTAMLSKSFRFGPAIANLANVVLDALDADLRIEGLDTIPSTVAPLANPDVYLSRTNATAVRRVLDAIKDGKRPHLVGGGGEVTAFAKAAGRLIAGERAEHPELACFDTWAEVLEYVDQDEQGGDLRLLVNLIVEFGVDTIIGALEDMPPEAQADIIVSTAHKSKGREWDTVQLASDFPTEPKGEELRLLYVGLTRARLTVDVTAVKYLHDAQEPGQATSPAPAPEAVTGPQDAPQTAPDAGARWDEAAGVLETLSADGYADQIKNLRRRATVERARAAQGYPTITIHPSKETTR